jgi:hypothetical protein
MMHDGLPVIKNGSTKSYANPSADKKGGPSQQGGTQKNEFRTSFFPIGCQILDLLTFISTACH